MRRTKRTIQNLFDAIWDEHWSSERFINSGYAKEVKANYNNHIKNKFGERDIKSIGQKEVREWHKAFKHPVAGNRTLEVFSRMFTFASEKEWVERNENPCLFLKGHRERKRKRYATQAEIHKIGELLDNSYKEDSRGVVFIYTLLYTGARPRSLERARWQDLVTIENGYGMLTFDGKTTADSGEEESVLIPPRIMELISVLPRRTDGLVFGIKIPRHLWYRIRKKAGCPDLWARDLRRTFATVGMSNGVKMDTIGELLNHKAVQTTKLYAKLDNSARLLGVEAITQKMDSILWQKTGAK